MYIMCSHSASGDREPCWGSLHWPADNLYCHHTPQRADWERDRGELFTESTIPCVQCLTQSNTPPGSCVRGTPVLLHTAFLPGLPGHRWHEPASHTVDTGHHCSLLSHSWVCRITRSGYNCSRESCVQLYLKGANGWYANRYKILHVYTRIIDTVL